MRHEYFNTTITAYEHISTKRSLAVRLIKAAAVVVLVVGMANYISALVNLSAGDIMSVGIITYLSIKATK